MSVIADGPRILSAKQHSQMSWKEIQDWKKCNGWATEPDDEQLKDIIMPELKKATATPSQLAAVVILGNQLHDAVHLLSQVSGNSSATPITIDVATTLVASLRTDFDAACVAAGM